MDSGHGLPDASQSRPRGPLPAWEIDLAWRASFLDALDDIKTVSFDVFDTAITRLVDSPVDVFAYAERELTVQFGDKARGFAHHREESEIEARAGEAAKGRREVSLDAIYARLAVRHPSIRPVLDHAMAAELAAEKSLCMGVPDIRQAYELALQAGKQIVFISDMYLPADFVRSLLVLCGYGAAPVLLISSETNRMKADGSIWPHVVQGAGPADSILHVGDDDWSDRHQPAIRGIRTLPFLRARSARRVGASPDPAILPFSLAQRHAVLTTRHTGPEAGSLAVRRMGQIFGGIAVGAFLRWLQQQVATCRTDHLFFCARDGWLLYRGWQAAGLGRKTGVKASYLQISRWPLHLARGHLEGEGKFITPALLRFLVPDEPNLDLKGVLQRAKLLHHAPIVEAAMRAVGPLETALAAPGAVAAVRRVIQENAEPVLAMATQEYHALAAYLKQEGFGQSNFPAIVDLGWHGTMQAALARMLQAWQRPVQLSGFYYALWNQATGQRPAAGWMEAAFASDFLTPAELRPLQLMADMLEELHGAPTGAVMGYRQEAGIWSPVYVDNPSERAAHDAITRPFQQGVLDTVYSLFTHGHSGPLRLSDMTPAAAVAAMRAVLLSPTSHEVALLGGLVHCRDASHVAALPVVAPFPAGACVHALQDEINQRSWQPGTLRAWRDTPGGAGHEAAHAIARNVFHSLPERCRRQFN